MKIKEFFVPKEDECNLCEIHTQAHKIISDDSARSCPKCEYIFTNSDLNYIISDADENIKTVGETNCSDIEEGVEKRIVFRCFGCGEHVSLKFDSITWNANHDVYYTGGKRYHPNGSEIRGKFKELATPLIENFVERVKNGENLNSWNLICWLENEVEHIVASYTGESIR